MNQGNFFTKCILLGLLAISLLGVVTMLLWNWLVPVLFKGPVISYWQSLGLLLLTKILTWSFTGKHHMQKGTNPYWKQRFQEKFSNMSAADKEAFKQKMKEKWCTWERNSSKEDATND